MMHWEGMAVHESIYAETFAPNRVHVHKDDQRLSYHKRIQKKWNKRFGQHSVPGMYKIGNDILVAHPEIIKKLRAASTLQRGI